MLSVNNVTLSFGGVQALSDVSFTMQANVIHGLIGPNGAGKTSLFNVVSGIYTPTAGSIRFDGKEISRLKLHQINRLGVARTQMAAASEVFDTEWMRRAELERMASS